jgi:heme-degrading monooxygenase HmoA
MFAYILRAQGPTTEREAELFRRFKETPGLIHAYSLQAEDNSNESLAIAIWESREAAEQYLNASALRREVDQAMPTVTRTLYTVLDSK